MKKISIAHLELRDFASLAEHDRIVIGRREWVAIPAIGVPAIDAKIDTGARTSSLHAENIATFSPDGTSERWVRFECFPLRGRSDVVIQCEARVHDEREVRSSNGESETRLIIKQTLKHGPLEWDVEISLTSRDKMRHRMLLGRTAISERFVVDTGHLHLWGTLSAKKHYSAQPKTDNRS